MTVKVLGHNWLKLIWIKGTVLAIILSDMKESVYEIKRKLFTLYRCY